MLGNASLRRVVKRMVSTFPLYRALPAGSARDYAALSYLSQRGPPKDLDDCIAAAARRGQWRLSAAIAAAGVAFRGGHDELTEEILDAALARYPEAAALHELRADLAGYRGDYAAAWAAAERARLLNPDSASATAKAVWRAYQVLGATADELAVDAVSRFPHANPVLWAVAKNCGSQSQLEAILAAWRERSGAAPKKLARAVRPLAHAASRVERFDVAVELYLRACAVELAGKGVGSGLKEKTLAGKGGTSVIGDLDEALSAAGIPYFLAAGTALGIVRDGKPLDHDSDIDVGIFDADWDRERLLEVFRRHPRFDLDGPHPRNQKVGLIHRGGAAIDIFRFYEEGGKLWHDGVFVRWHNSPFTLGERSLGDRKILVPAPEDQYLTECYGDWRTPDKTFDAFVVAPNVEIVWPEYHDYHRLRRTYKYIRAGERPMAFAELKAIRATVQLAPSGPAVLEALAC